jgi:hypothetical protein
MCLGQCRQLLSHCFLIQFEILSNSPANGEFTIASVVFEALAPGESIISILESSEFFAPIGPILPDTIDTQIAVSAVPLPPAALLFLFGVGWVYRLSRSGITKLV